MGESEGRKRGWEGVTGKQCGKINSETRERERKRKGLGENGQETQM